MTKMPTRHQKLNQRNDCQGHFQKSSPKTGSILINLCKYPVDIPVEQGKIQAVLLSFIIHTAAAVHDIVNIIM